MDDSKKKWLIAFSVSLGGIMSSLDTFILFVATPNLRGIFSATIAEISWVSTSYAIASMTCMFLSAWFVGRYGSRSVYLGGLAFFAAGSVFCSMSVTLEQLVFARVIQGLGAGVLLPVEGVILRKTFPPKQHGLVIGLYGTSIMFGPAFGPMLGGIIIDQYSWQLIFILNIPIVIISAVMVRKFLVNENTEENKKTSHFDFMGVILLLISVISLIWLLERGERTFWLEDDFNLLLIVVSFASWAFLIAHSLMVEKPLLDFRILQYRVFATANMLNFFAAFLISGTLFVLPIYMQELLEFSPTQAGTAMAPRAFVMMLAFPFVGWLFNRVPAIALITFGIGMGILSGVMMSGFTAETGWHDMILPQIIQGVSAAFILGPVTTAALISIPKPKMPNAAALEATTRLLGSTIGIAAFSTLITHYQLRTWELLRHNVTLSSTVLYKRFNGVIDFFYSETSSSLFALEKAYRALNGRVTEQVQALTYMNLFQIITLGFLIMLVLSFGLSLKPKPEAVS
ncbi:DHA2 family efflux MFS transporter permease subunit [Catenovulum sp. SM1970]|uniref:DHA2 family efflux MFS transporter permease subunit n=1 Tax=Marinifaba aquimaris TaxID=2741323 RepID=UPI0015746348|nr:DHA2 family efflux MFS transporter permease subunit [Marinifaba aquimaris]NTS75293.1 DHA2 family efflux MFS transporter permease subunit [Marinifaba aquimaris]